MSTPLRVLIVEDSEDDADLLVRELRRGGFEPGYLVVSSADTVTSAIEKQEWDVVLCDFTMAGFSGTQALSLIRSRGVDTPFIYVSGTIGEETAVAAMKAGAQDYVLKDNLARLVPAIERELRDVAVRRDRERAELARAAAERRFRQVLEMAPDAIIALDHDQRIVVFNRAAEDLFGYGAEEVSGQFVDLLLPSRVAEAHRGHIAAFAASDTSSRRMGEGLEIFGRRKNGEEFPAEASISKLEENGQITFMAAVRDITQRRQLESELRQSQKMEAVGQLAGGLTHDFNNLLTIIIGNLDQLTEEVGDNDRAQELVGSALSAGLRGGELTRQLLAYARRQSLEPRAFNLNERVEATTGILRRTLGEQIEIKMKLAAHLPALLADPTQVESALINLAINARDAMPDGGKLIIETAGKILDAQYAAENVEVAPGDYVMLAVSDTGEGIPPEILDRVFEPFFTTKEKGRGTGLGLSTIFGFVKQSGGHMKVYSEVGHGTTVRIYLPRADGNGEEVSESRPARTEGDLKGVRVLVVEDDPDVRGVAVAQLEALECEVVEADGGASALEALEKEGKFDLLFTDLVMPGGMSGADLAREARKRLPDLKVLFTSGYAEAALESSTLAGRVGAILSKPYRIQDLARKMRDILNR